MGAGLANAVPGAASTVTAQTTATAVVIRARLAVPLSVPVLIPCPHIHVGRL
ncbi:hypothetical protein [Streptomyces sp. NPDC010273]|uniref:hypothetical protein n=1 Tax=Streptomyces sp. NPDC010273 TaxID=3364829 RepID=UPI0036F18AF1